jgi:hypothetical protein
MYIVYPPPGQRAFLRDEGDFIQGLGWLTKKVHVDLTSHTGAELLKAQAPKVVLLGLVHHETNTLIKVVEWASASEAQAALRGAELVHPRKFSLLQIYTGTTSPCQ